MPATAADPGAPGFPGPWCSGARLARPVGGGIRSAEIRCRKTQYVHVWYATVSGAKNAVTHVMILRVYGVDDALWIVRLHCGFRVEGTRFGYSAPNSSTTTAATTINVHMNAQPSDTRRHTKTVAAACAHPATASTSHVQSLPYASCVQSPKPATSPATGSESHTANR